MVAIAEFRSLKKLEGEEKKNYLDNLRLAVSKVNNLSGLAIPTLSLYQLINVLSASDCVEIDLANGLPSAMKILQIDRMSKDVKKEFQDLKSRISVSMVSEEGKSLEQMIVEKIKSKIYSFDTVAADTMAAEGEPFHEILSTEFTLRDRLSMLKAIEANPFALNPDVVIDYNFSSAGYYTSRFEVRGFDPKENNFAGYKFVLDFNKKGKKRIIDSENAVLKPVYVEILKRQFSTGDLDSMYKEFSDIKHTWLRSVTKSTLGPYWNKHTDMTDLDNIFKDHPNAYVLNVSHEIIETGSEHGAEFKRTDTTKMKKTKTLYKISPEDIVQKLRGVYKDNENVKVIS